VRKHLPAVLISVGSLLFSHGLTGLKLDYKGDVLSGWYPQESFCFVLTVHLIAFLQRFLLCERIPVELDSVCNRPIRISATNNWLSSNDADRSNEQTSPVTVIAAGPACNSERLRPEADRMTSRSPRSRPFISSLNRDISFAKSVKYWWGELMMNFLDQLDPELRAVVEKLPTDRPLNLNKIPAARAGMKKMVTALLASFPPIDGVTSQDQFAPGAQGDPAVRVRVYRPKEQASKLPALFWIHGGGYVMGDIDQDDRLMMQLVKRIGCVAVSVDYRLAPEHPFPAPVEDCYAGLKWLFTHASEFGVEASRIAIGGASGGGGLCAGLALMVRDRGEVPVAFQLLIYPMIDDRNVSAASYAITDPRMWNRESNRLGWKAYLGRDGGGADVSPYAAPSRATDLSKLPPAYIPVGALDLFVDENIEYAQRLIQAGVPTELHVYPGAFHGFDLFAPSAKVSKQFKADRDDALKRALHGAAK